MSEFDIWAELSPKVLTDERLDEIERELADGGSAYDYVRELIEGARAAGELLDASVPMEQA